MIESRRVIDAIKFDLNTDVIRWKNWSQYLAKKQIEPALFLKVGGIINALEDAMRAVIAEEAGKDA